MKMYKVKYKKKIFSKRNILRVDVEEATKTSGFTIGLR